MRITVPLGTRPEIVKLAPIVSELARRGHVLRVVSTGQHFNANLTDSFFEDLGFTPDVRWTLPSEADERVGRILTLAMEELRSHPTDLVLTLGDTYTVPLFCIAARRFTLPVVHVEAVLRSFNQTSMEETNRKIAAATARFNFAPTEMAATFLAREGVPPERIRVVGNSVIDSLVSRHLARRPLAEREGVLVTVHRATNVDRPERLTLIVEALRRLSEEIGHVTFPVHPRTRSRLVEQGLWGALERPSITLAEPLPYDELLDALAGSRLVVTDSGGLQEESAYLGVPTIVLRNSTPRWEGVKLGIAALSEIDVHRILELARRLVDPDEQARIAGLECPYGKGDTSVQIADALEDPAVLDVLPILDPNMTAVPE